MGVSLSLTWISLIRYLTYTPKIAPLPNTIVGSARQVANGSVGLLPLLIGFSFLASTSLYMNFRFKDPCAACFVIMYNMNGDTLFDTIYGSLQWSKFFTMVWSYFAVVFASFVYIKITLAMIEDGYVFNKYKRQFDWLFHPEKEIGNNQAAVDTQEVQQNQIIEQMKYHKPPEALRKVLI